MTTLSFDSFLTPKNYAYFDQNKLQGRVVLRNSDICIEKTPSLLNRYWNFQTIQEENQKIWALFKKALLKEPVQVRKKVERVLRNYSTQGDFEKKHIDIVLTSLYSLHISDLGPSPERLSTIEIAKKIQELIEKNPPLIDLDFPVENQTIYETLFADVVSLEKEKIAAVYKLSTFKTIQEYWEYFTRRIVARSLEEGMIIPFFRGEDFYYVYKKINQGGLVAYALKPLSNDSKQKPIICFRPTQIVLRLADAVTETLLDDLHLKGVGYGGFQSARKELEELMADSEFCQENEKILVLGYSLGGAYAQYFTAYQENWRRISEAIFFNDPGVDRKTVERFARKVNRIDLKEGEAPSLSLFRTEGDLIDHHGELHLGAGVSPYSQAKVHLTLLLPPSTATKLDRHFNCYVGSGEKQFFDLKEPKYQYLLDNAKRGRTVLFWESWRRWIGFFVRPLTSLLNLLLKRFFQEKFNLT